MTNRVWRLILVLTALVPWVVVGNVHAQDGTTFEPFTDQLYGIEGILPVDWEAVGQGSYVRGATPEDPTALIIQAAPATMPQAILELVSQQYQQDTIPESMGETTTDALTWTLYNFSLSVQGFDLVVDLALAEADGTTYIAVLQTESADYDALHETVFVPVLASLRPFVEEFVSAVNNEAVTFDNGDITLAGTLSIPAGEGPFPALILVSGSGPQDRDSYLAPAATIRPFRLIAEYLTSNGYVVLRYDDRGVGESTGDFGSAILSDFASDASAAINYLATCPEVDTDRIGILGHSEGGMIAPQVAVENGQVDFMILMAPPTVPGIDILLLQMERLLTAEGIAEPIAEEYAQRMNSVFDLALANQDDMEAIEAELRNTLTWAGENDIENPSMIDELVARSLAQITDDWYLDFLRYDAAPWLTQTDIPTLAIFGALDAQVDADQNVAGLIAATDAPNRDDVEIVVLEDANHLFQAAITGAFSEYSALDDTFTPDFLPTILEWLNANISQ